MTYKHNFEDFDDDCLINKLSNSVSTDKIPIYKIINGGELHNKPFMIKPTIITVNSTIDVAYFLLYNRRNIEQLYMNYDRSFNIIGNGKSFFHTFNFPGFGSKIYTSQELQQLETSANYTSLYSLIDILRNIPDNMCNKTILDCIIKIIFKIRGEAVKLYRAVDCATNRSHHFFSNPLSDYYGFIPHTIKMNGQELLELNSIYN